VLHHAQSRVRIPFQTDSSPGKHEPRAEPQHGTASRGGVPNSAPERSIASERNRDLRIGRPSVSSGASPTSVCHSNVYLYDKPPPSDLQAPPSDIGPHHSRLPRVCASEVPALVAGSPDAQKCNWSRLANRRARGLEVERSAAAETSRHSIRSAAASCGWRARWI